MGNQTPGHLWLGFFFTLGEMVYFQDVEPLFGAPKNRGIGFPGVNTHGYLCNAPFGALKAKTRLLAVSYWLLAVSC